MPPVSLSRTACGTGKSPAPMDGPNYGFKRRIPNVIAPSVVGFETYCNLIPPKYLCTCWEMRSEDYRCWKGGSSRLCWFVPSRRWRPSACSSNIARADDCLVAPGPTPRAAIGTYLTERATQKKCWHLSDASQVSKSRRPRWCLKRLNAGRLIRTAARARNGLSEEDVQTLYAQFLEWKRRTGQ